MRELNGEAADAARRAGYKNSATKDRGAEPENAQRGQAGGWQRGRLREGHAVGQLRDPRLRYRDPLSPRLALPDAHHSGTSSRTADDVGPQHAGEVPSGTPAIGRSPQHPQLAAIHRERSNLHDYFAGRW